MCEHVPTWTGPWCSYDADVIQGGSVIVDSVHQYRCHCYCEVCGDFWTRKVNMEKLREMGYQYADLERLFSNVGGGA